MSKEFFHPNSFENLSSRERKISTRIGSIFKNTKNIIDHSINKALPEMNIPTPPSISIVPDSEFRDLILRASPDGNKTQTEKNIELLKIANIANAAYLDCLSNIVFPEKTAESILDNNLLKNLSFSGILAEEYLHHISTIVSPEGYIERTGFYQTGKIKKEKNVQEPGTVKFTHLNQDISPNVPESDKEDSIILTENTTSYLVHSLMPKLNFPVFQNHNLMTFISGDHTSNKEYGIFAPKELHFKMAARALISGDTDFLKFDIPSSVGKGDINFYKWLSSPSFQVCLLDLNQSTGMEKLDIFSYKDTNISKN